MSDLLIQIYLKMLNIDYQYVYYCSEHILPDAFKST